mmetsp:Transcript_3493/g.6177  ORF Transcript_3493/g.6177 Transcript_3493/m.6177 type:complete len:88 (+) Transcript_3493:111-374(+)
MGMKRAFPLGRDGGADRTCTEEDTCRLMLGGWCKAPFPPKGKRSKACDTLSFAVAGASGSANASCDHCIKSVKAGGVVLPEDTEEHV